MLTCRSCGQRAPVDPAAHPTGLAVCARCDTLVRVPVDLPERADRPGDVRVLERQGVTRLQVRPTVQTDVRGRLLLAQGALLLLLGVNVWTVGWAVGLPITLTAGAGVGLAMASVSRVWPTVTASAAGVRGAGPTARWIAAGRLAGVVVRLPVDREGLGAVVAVEKDGTRTPLLEEVLDARAGAWLAGRIEAITGAAAEVLPPSTPSRRGEVVSLGVRCAACGATGRTTGEDRSRGWRVCGVCGSCDPVAVAPTREGWRLWPGPARRLRFEVRPAAEGITLVPMVSPAQTLARLPRVVTGAVLASAVVVGVLGVGRFAAWIPTALLGVILVAMVVASGVLWNRVTVRVDPAAIRWRQRPWPWGVPDPVPGGDVQRVVVREQRDGFAVCAVLDAVDRTVVSVPSASEAFALAADLRRALGQSA